MDRPPPHPPRRLRRILLGLLAGAALSFAGCGTPARVSRSNGHLKKTSDDPAALLREALRDPDSAASVDALGHFVERWKQDGRGPSGEVTLPAGPGGGAVTLRVRFEALGEGCYPLEYFDRISPADDFKVRGIAHHRREGVGAPLVALRENRRRDGIEAHYPREAITRPVTAVMEVGPGSRDVTIRLLCPLRNDGVSRGGRVRALAADFSVPWAALLARTGKLRRAGFLDVVLTRRPRFDPQLLLMEPYDPRKEPLIMIHGLFSTPLAWARVSNDLWAVDAIRRRYQIWHYLYNTSAPALYSARMLRTQLREVRSLLDPEGDDPAMRRTTLLTHSMGGVIGKALVVRPGDAYWKAALTVPPGRLNLGAEDRARLNDAFEWQPDATVHRIIFVAVPHRGSDFADNGVGRLGRWLARPPASFTEFYRRISAANPGAFTPEYLAMWEGRLDSVGALSPRMPTLQILSSLPFAHPVRAHSIIGNRGRPGPPAESSDGIVPYSSSHLEGAASERIVPTGHRAFEHPEAMAEIRRVLMLP